MNGEDSRGFGERLEMELSCTGSGRGDVWDGSGAAWALKAETAEINSRIPNKVALWRGDQLLDGSLGGYLN